MTTYSEFKDFYLREIWREGDDALMQDLDKLISRAESRISRDLRHINVARQTLISASTQYTALPGDFREIISVTRDGYPLQLVSLDRANSYLQPNNQRAYEGTVYWLMGNKQLEINLPEAFDPPVDLLISYFMGLVPYATDPPSPFYDEHPDFYTAAVNVAVYSYLRDFELSAEYNSQYDKLLEGMRVESNYIMFPSGQLDMPMPTSAPTIKRSSPATPVNVWNDDGIWGD